MDAVDPNQFVEDVRTELVRVTQNVNDSEDSFVVYSDLQAIWSRSRVQTLLKLCCLCPEKQLDQVAEIVLQHYLKIISVLTQIPWHWSRFIEVFLGNSTGWDEVRMLGRHDDSLPFLLSDLRDLLGNCATGFDFQQWLFLPIRIGEQESDYTGRYRLPVLKTEPLGLGASGVVYKETIAAGCLVLSSGSLNTEKIQVARKHIETQEDFDSESVVIERLKNNRLNHRHITECYGVVVREGKLKKKKLDIFYELASSNLSQFLMNFGDHLPSTEVQHHLLDQMSSLIDALVHCHEHFFDREEGDAILVHNDLKPENILVFPAGPRKSPVGTWKIADFGLSKIKVAQDLDSLPVTLSKAPRPPGGYTAPEIVRQGSLLRDSSSVQCDIWSLGCILAQVFVFAVGGTQAVKKFNDLRLPNNSFNYRDDRYFERHPSLERLRLKRPLFQMLGALRDPLSETDWTNQFVNLIFDVLRVEKNPHGDGEIIGGPRLKASDIRARFLAIQRSHKLLLKRESVSTVSTDHNTRQIGVRRHTLGDYGTPAVTTSPPPRLGSPGSDLLQSPPPFDNGQRSDPADSIRDESSIELTQTTGSSSVTEPEPTVPSDPLFMKPSFKLPAINISCGPMTAVELNIDTSMVTYWSNKQVVIYSLSSVIRSQLFEHSLETGSQRKINSVTISGGTLAITIGTAKSDEIRLFRITDRKHHKTLILGEVDHFRRVLLGTNDTVALIYDNYLRVGTMRDSLENFKMINLKSDTEHFFQPSISLDGKWLVICSRDNQKSQVENWHFIDLSVPLEALKDLVLSNPMPPPDNGPTAPALMIPLQDTVGIYYSTGDFALYQGTKNGCKLLKNIAFAVATGSSSNIPGRQFVAYAVERKFFGAKTDIWYVEMQRHGGCVKTSKEPTRLLALNRKLKQTSLGFSWVKEDKLGPRIFCVLVAFQDGSIWCLKLPDVEPRWLD